MRPASARLIGISSSTTARPARNASCTCTRQAHTLHNHATLQSGCRCAPLCLPPPTHCTPPARQILTMIRQPQALQMPLKEGCGCRHLGVEEHQRHNDLHRQRPQLVRGIGERHHAIGIHTHQRLQDSPVQKFGGRSSNAVYIYCFCGATMRSASTLISVGRTAPHERVEAAYQCCAQFQYLRFLEQQACGRGPGCRPSQMQPHLRPPPAAPATGR